MATKELRDGIDHLLITMIDCLDTPAPDDVRSWLMPLWRREIEPYLASGNDYDWRALHRCRVLARVSGRWPALLRKLEAAIPETANV